MEQEWRRARGEARGGEHGGGGRGKGRSRRRTRRNNNIHVIENEIRREILNILKKLL